MIDPETDELISFTALVKKLPRTGNRPVHISTAHRWRTVGLSGGIKLEAIRVGGVWVTSWQAFRQFCYRLTLAEDRSVTPRNGPAAPEKKTESANQSLEMTGW